MMQHHATTCPENERGMRQSGEMVTPDPYDR